MDHLATAEQVIDALGGLTATAALMGRGYTTASMWQTTGRFPSNTYVAMTEMLAAKGKTAPASLWGMVEAPSEQESAA